MFNIRGSNESNPVKVVETQQLYQWRIQMTGGGSSDNFSRTCEIYLHFSWQKFCQQLSTRRNQSERRKFRRHPIKTIIILGRVFHLALKSAILTQLCEPIMTYRGPDWKIRRCLGMVRYDTVVHVTIKTRISKGDPDSIPTQFAVRNNDKWIPKLRIRKQRRMAPSLFKK